MPVVSYEINTHGELTTPSPRPGGLPSQAPYRDIGSCEAFGGGVFLTAAHLFTGDDHRRSRRSAGCRSPALSATFLQNT